MAATFVHQLIRHARTSAHLSAAVGAADQLTGLDVFDVPGWADLADGVRPPPRNPGDFELGGHRSGWQLEAAASVASQHRERNLPVAAVLCARMGPASVAEWASSRHELLTCAVEFSHQDRVSVVPCVARPSLASSVNLPLSLLAFVQMSPSLRLHRARKQGRRGFAVESAL